MLTPYTYTPLRALSDCIITILDVNVCLQYSDYVLALCDNQENQSPRYLTPETILCDMLIQTPRPSSSAPSKGSLESDPWWVHLERAAYLCWYIPADLLAQHVQRISQHTPSLQDPSTSQADGVVGTLKILYPPQPDSTQNPPTTPQLATRPGHPDYHYLPSIDIAIVAIPAS